MASTLKSRSENASLRRQIAEDNARARYLQFLNDNLAQTRKRKTGWTIPSAAERDFDSRDRRNAMAQARQLVDENPLALGILRAHLDFVVGSEFVLQMRSGDKAWDAAVEAWWLQKRDLIDIRGVRGWGSWLRMVHARRKVDGDVGVVLVEDESQDGPKAWVQVIEADRIWKASPTDPQDTGVEADAYGMPRKFFVGPRNPKPDEKGKPYDARYFHLYLNVPNERAEVVRGMSSFLQLLNLLKDLGETEEAMALKAKAEAFIGLKFKTTTPDLNPFGAAGYQAADEAGATRPHVSLVPGLNLSLLPNEDAEIMESKSPHADYLPYIRHRIRLAGIPWGLPLEFILADSSQTNYSGLLALGQMLKRSVRVQQYELRQLCSRVFRWALAYEGRSIIGEPPANLRTWFDHAWGVPSSGFADPLKESKAATELISLGVTTRQRLIADMFDGDEDWQDIAEQLNKENGLLGKPPASQPDQTEEPQAPANEANKEG